MTQIKIRRYKNIALWLRFIASCWKWYHTQLNLKCE